MLDPVSVVSFDPTPATDPRPPVVAGSPTVDDAQTRRTTPSKRPADSVRNKLALLRLADELGSVVRACQLMGYSRGSYYRIRTRYLAEGEEGLAVAVRRSNEPSANRLDPQIEEVVVELSLANPDWGRRRLVGALSARGIPLSASGVRCVWKRRGLLTARQRGRVAKAATTPRES